MISEKDIIEINKAFNKSKVTNKGSLAYAVKTTTRSKNWLKTAAILTKGILIDHAFEDGNKRTAAAVIMLIMDINNIQYNPEKIPKIIIKILLKNMTNIKNIERCIKDGIA